jgi:hypothetical protein
MALTTPIASHFASNCFAGFDPMGLGADPKALAW